MLLWGRLTPVSGGAQCGHQRGHSASPSQQSQLMHNLQVLRVYYNIEKKNTIEAMYMYRIRQSNCLIFLCFCLFSHVCFRMLCFDSKIIKVWINRKLYLLCVLSPGTPHSASPLGEKNPICGNFMEILFPRRPALSSIQPWWCPSY